MADFSKETIPQYLTPAQVAILTQPVPQHLIDKKNGFDYVHHSFVTSVLNQAFGLAWNWKILDHGIEEAKPYKNKYSNNNAAPADAPKSYYAWVKGELTVPAVNPIDGNTIWISKQAFGSKPVIGGNDVQQSLYKSCSSDAFKKASSSLGIARTIYYDSKVLDLVIAEETDSDSWEVGWKCDLYAEECAAMRELKEEIGADKVAALIKTYCDETNDYTKYNEITPSNICGFLDYVAVGKQALTVVNPAQTATAAPAPRGIAF